eukprot:TRINITY_DN72809_c0_g1_i1.p1 TRINITY_DN72809_c0_g1~~TRINITY_DN72809_c0_g1_i1.p1  ORF type:complete len:217 (-),score=58.43 TRINITY_DN72809_c0_g1_i1:92-742(-)
MAPVADVEKLLSYKTRYDREILPDLIAHLDSQIKDGSYSADANLAILKLYSLYPEEADVSVMEKILVKALMAYPETDFALCMYQIHEKYHTQLEAMTLLAKQLEMAKFPKFWKDAEGMEQLNAAKGWKEAIRKFIAGVVSATYRSIRIDQLTELLSMTAKELEVVIKERGWTRSKEDKDIIVVNKASFESAKVEVKPQTNMSIDQYRTLFMAATSA